MQKRIFCPCSIILVLTLLLNMLPMTIFAEKLNDSLAATKPDTTLKDAVTSETYVVDEDESKRTEYTKEFILSNGTRMATVYADAVHYMTNNGWSEIDNTLMISTDGTLSNTAGIWSVQFPSQLSKDKGVRIVKDDYALSFAMENELRDNTQLMSTPEPEVPEVTLPVIESQETEDTEETLATAETQETEIVEETLTTAETQETEIVEETLAATASQEAETPEETLPIVEIPEPESSQETFSIAEIQESAAIVQQLDLDTMRESVAYREIVPEKLQSRLTYENVFENTHIVYDLESNKVKESIIINSYNEKLQGYRYTLQVGELIPVLEDSGKILFYDRTQENVVMAMPAPYMQDADNNFNGDVEVQLTGSAGTYTLTYLLPRQWLAESDRSWPVILDPIVEAEVAASNIEDQTVSEKHSLDYTWGMMEAGYSDAWGVARFFIKYKSLPEITSSDVVINAVIQLCKGENSSNSASVEAHKVNGTWSSQTITWSNKPGYNSNIEDYAVVKNAGYYGWVVTDIVRQWYSGPNTGMMFKVSDSVESAKVNNYKQFVSSDYGYNKPILTVEFRNNNGLESYWDYTSSGAGRAGTGHINNFTGNLVWTRDDIGFGGNRMPVTISHIYNLNDAVVINDSNNSNDSGGNTFGAGIGWRTNFNQLVYRWSENNSLYVWEDSDGTDHYFRYDSSKGKYKDEDGLELTLTDTGSGTEKYCITDKNGNCSYFDTQGRLTKLSNNQQTKSHITITYRDSTDRRISKITDGVGRAYNFFYDNNFLCEIQYTGTGTTALHSVQFFYDASRLIRVCDADGEESTYTYNSNSLLLTATDIDGYKLTYEYTEPQANWQPYRVLRVSETDGTAQGGTLNFAYAHNQTTITDHNGNVNIIQFNDLGNTISVQDDQGRAQYAQYAKNNDEESGKANQLKVSSKLQTSVGNIAKNTGFEVTQLWVPNNSAVTVGRSNEAAYAGSYSLKVVNSSNSTLAALTNGFYIEPGDTYTFSAYVKTTTATAQVALQYGATYHTMYGELLDRNQDWTRTYVSYTNKTGASIKITPILFLTSAGTAYMDNIQIEKSPTPSRYNIIENGDFTFTDYSGWTRNALTTEDTFVTLSESPAQQLDKTAFRITGDPTGYRQLIQYVQRSGSAGDSYVLSGWAKGNSVPLSSYDSNEREFEIEAILHYHDGTSSRATLQFNPDSDKWQYASDATVAKQAYFSITVIIRYNFNANTVYFDGIQLFKEEFGSSYTYDADGNVTSVRDLQGKITSYEYNTDNDLTKIIQDNKAKMTYTYDDWHNVKTAVSEEGLSYGFNYDTWGNNSGVSITNGTKTISSSAVYTDDGNRLVSTADALGEVTAYQYDPDTNVLEWVQYPEDTEQTRTEYTYDSMFRLASAACDTDTGLALSAEYTYTDDLLTSIETPSTTYSFTYGDFSLRTEVNIGSRNLASYAYTDDGYYYLSALDYGNDDRIEYTYDDQGRVTAQTYEDADTVTFTYDHSGNLVRETDSGSGITTTYYYDLTGRLIKRSESNGVSISYQYDSKNNLTYISERIDGSWRGTYYTYDQDNRVTRMYKGRGARAYVYDDLGRILTEKAQYDGSVKITEAYGYQDNDDKASGQIATHTITAGENSKTYSYTYDDNGNITSISDGTNTTSYVYDSANQLIRENNQAGNFTHTWTYDNAGNILTRKEYAYTTGELGDPTDTVSYTYGDDDGDANGDDDEGNKWGDLLTEFNGNAITYDEIGNPLSDGTWNYTWEHGRELSSMTDGTTTWNYTYDADGMRIQRTNGSSTYSYVYEGGQLMRMMADNTMLNFAYDADGDPLTLLLNDSSYYFYVTNLQGDVIALTDPNGTEVVRYAYDAWGNVIAIDGSMAATLGVLNPLRYRGYVYDAETGLYYVSSRYYDPEIGRFINADTTDILTATPMGLTDKNLFAYCDNNPVVRVDHGGQFWDTVFDVISLGASIVEVCVNPTDPWAWAGLAGDAIDLIPFVTGVGEVTRAVKITVKVVDKATDVVDTAKTIYKTADAASDIRKATGSYEILYKSGKNYIGKGGFNRAITSATRNATKYGDEVTSIMWKSAPNSRSAFIDEYLMQKRFGGVLSSNRDLLTYNKIWSPGRRYFGD